MVCDDAMQPQEVFAIDGDDAAACFDGETQHGIVLNGLIRLAHVMRGEHIMTQSTEAPDDLHGEVLVGVEAAMSVSGLVFPNLAVNLLRMTRHIVPGVDQIG